MYNLKEQVDNFVFQLQNSGNYDIMPYLPNQNWKKGDPIYYSGPYWDNQEVTADAFEAWTVHSYAGDYNPLHDHGCRTEAGLSMLAKAKGKSLDEFKRENIHLSIDEVDQSISTPENDSVEWAKEAYARLKAKQNEDI